VIKVSATGTTRLLLKRFQQISGGASGTFIHEAFVEEEIRFKTVITVCFLGKKSKINFI
jgi:hypothetical protein